MRGDLSSFFMQFIHLFSCVPVQLKVGSNGDLTTTLGAVFPTLYKKGVGSLTYCANQCKGDAGDGNDSLSSLSKKTIMSDHLWML